MQLFRRLIPEDWESFKNLEEGAFTDQKTSKENFLQVTESVGFIGFIVNNELVGYLKLGLMENYGHLGQIAVKPADWGKGYGSKMMDFTIDYFRKNNIERVGLYVETKNERAISLYKKYGFDFAFESWHYWIEEKYIKDIEKREKKQDTVNLRILDLDDYDLIVNTFSEINEGELKVHLITSAASLLGESIPLGLFLGDKLIVYGRFNPEFSGSRPFLCTEFKYVDLFLAKLKKYRKKEYIRLTFDKNKELANLFEKRGCKLWHHLQVMEKTIER